MRIINGLKHDRRVVSLLDLEDLVELTSDGFRPMQLRTLEEVAARLRAAEERQSWLFAELEYDVRGR